MSNAHSHSRNSSSRTSVTTVTRSSTPLRRTAPWTSQCELVRPTSTPRTFERTRGSAASSASMPLLALRSPAIHSEQVVTREPRMHDHGPRSPDRLRAPRDPERILEVGVASGGRHRFRAGGLRQRVVREPQPVHQPVERQIVEDDDPRVPHREPVDRPVELDVVPQLEDADVRRANALLGAGSRWPHRVDVVFGGEPDLVEPAQHRRGVRRDPRLRGGQGRAERDVRHRLTRPSGGRPPATAGCGR